MSLLPIHIFGDPVLRERAHEVIDFDQALRALADNMLETMRAAQGAGLAGNQVGVLKRLFTWQLPGEDDAQPNPHGAWVNPEITETSEELQEGDEGCLSFPGLFYPTERPLRARMRAQDVFGDPHEVAAEGHLARIILHEVDHLNGILFIDHLARHSKKDAMRRIRSGELERNAAGEGEGAPSSAGVGRPL
jgi:peptide deformylase